MVIRAAVAIFAGLFFFGCYAMLRGLGLQHESIVVGWLVMLMVKDLFAELGW